MLEPIENQYVKIGRIARSHGVQGVVLIIPELYAPDIFDEIDLVRLQNARGDLIPARIESVRVQEKNNRLSFFVKFDHVTDGNEAEKLKNMAVFVDRKQVEPRLEDEATNDRTGYSVFDENGKKIGIVEDIIDNPAQPILVVQAKENQRLIPMVDEYVTDIDEKEAIIRVQNVNQLDGLA
ncbi:MAG TPA: ribosome maturation factor RimM [Balneolaceae bacterium]|nr:ribosome maturation factor RimM [Balneolaceae bacterium]